MKNFNFLGKKKNLRSDSTDLPFCISCRMQDAKDSKQNCENNSESNNPTSHNWHNIIWVEALVYIVCGTLLLSPGMHILLNELSMCEV